MEGLSIKRRRIYLGILVLIFFIVAPVLVLYSSGYRVSDDLSFIKTGGIHINVPQSGASFYLNGKFKGTGSIFQKGFFVQNLTPGTYTIRVEKDGRHLWQKQLEVYPTIITEAKALLLPKKSQLTPIFPYIDLRTGKATDTPPIGRDVSGTNSRYKEIIKIFEDESIASEATTTIFFQGATTTVRSEGGIGLWRDNKGVHTWWLKEAEESPYFFCISEKKCNRELLIYQGQREISHFDFLPDDNQFVLLERDDGIYVTELDIRPIQNTQPFYNKPGAKFRIFKGTIYVLNGDALFEADI